MSELKNNDAIQLFEDKKIRTAWDEEEEEWVHQRLLAIRIRNELTEAWKRLFLYMDKYMAVFIGGCRTCDFLIIGAAVPPCYL